MLHLVDELSSSKCSSSALAELSLTMEIYEVQRTTQQATESLVNKVGDMTASCELLRETDENTKASWKRFIIACAVRHIFKWKIWRRVNFVD